MDPKILFAFRLVFGIFIITAVCFIAFRFLLKTPPIVKVLALGVVAGTIYLVISYLIKKSKAEN